MGAATAPRPRVLRFCFLEQSHSSGPRLLCLTPLPTSALGACALGERPPGKWQSPRIATQGWGTAGTHSPSSDHPHAGLNTLPLEGVCVHWPFQRCLAFCRSRCFVLFFTPSS